MQSAFLKTGKEETIIYVDKETGEVLSEDKKVHKYVANDKEQFFFAYYSLVSEIQKLSGPAIKTYFYLVLNYKPANLIGINKVVKNKIKEFIHSKSIGTVNNCLTELCNAKLLYKSKDGLGGYFIHPKYVFKGGTIERKKVLQEFLTTIGEAA
ncbi:MAG: replication/maintenance protein RepL [Chitinophagaceae bacterium]